MQKRLTRKWPIKFGFAFMALVIATCVCIAIWLVVPQMQKVIERPSVTKIPSGINVPTSTPTLGALVFASSIASPIANALTAQDVSGDNFDPVGITDSFQAGQTIFHTVVTIVDAPDNTEFKVVWLNSSDSQVGEYTLYSKGSRNLDFTLKPNDGTLAPGKYKVEIYVNGKLDRTLTFSVGNSAK